MSAEADDALELGGSPDFRVLWTDRRVLALLPVHLVSAVVLAVVLDPADRDRLGDRVVLYAALLALIPLLGVVAVSVRPGTVVDREGRTVPAPGPNFPGLGAVLLRAGFTAPVLTVGAVVEALLLAVAGVVARGADPDGLYLLLGGAAGGLFFGALLGSAALLLLGGALAWPATTRGHLPWWGRASLPLMLLSIPAVATGLTFGSSVEGRGVGALVVALLDSSRTTSAPWLALARVSAAAFALGLALALRRLGGRPAPGRSDA